MSLYYFARSCFIKKIRISCTLFTLLFLSVLPVQLYAQTSDINFTAEQVEAGRLSYREHCQICHGSSLANGQFGTPLRGSFFRNSWAGKSLGELIQFTYESMPPDDVMLLSTEQYAESVAYILSRNNIEPTGSPITGNYEELTAVMLPW